MRKMHPSIELCVESLMKVITEIAKSRNNEIDAKKLMGNLTMDIIATCAFATKTDTHNDPNNPFVRNALKILAGSKHRIILTAITLLLPKEAKLFNIQPIDPSSLEFFKTAVSDFDYSKL
jgi:hypothetical protein